MSPAKLSKPIEQWPDEIRGRFLAEFLDASESQTPRLRQGMGRWLKLADDDDLPPEVISPALIESRGKTMRPELAVAMKQALQVVFPDVPVFIKAAPEFRECSRDALNRGIRRNWGRFPATWRDPCAQALKFSQDGLDDGRLVEAWAPSGLLSKLESGWAFFDFCRENGLPEDVVPKSVKARLAYRQAAFRADTVSLAYCLAEMQRLYDLTHALFPDRDLLWMKPAIAVLKAKAKLEPSRNSGRVVDLAELRVAALTCGDVALRSQQRNSNHRSRECALKLSRTGLAISILINSPIRLQCLAGLDLETHLDPGLTKLYLAAHETKDGKRDVRILPPKLQSQISSYVVNHRRYFAPLDETALFVGSRGKQIGPGYLSQCLGDLTSKLFGKRVTANVMRNIIASFIVSEAPQQASLAGEILNHTSSATTETYRSEGQQIVAGAALRAAHDQGRSHSLIASKS